MADYYGAKLLTAPDSAARDALAAEYQVARRWLRILTELSDGG
jgi:hypothetical protein